VQSYEAKPCRASYGRSGSRPLWPPCRFVEARATPTLQETIMGKYLLAWLLGVPGIVLVLVYLFFH